MAYCSECGKKMANNAKTCPKCSINTLLALSVTYQLHLNHKKIENTNHSSESVKLLTKKSKKPIKD